MSTGTLLNPYGHVQKFQQPGAGLSVNDQKLASHKSKYLKRHISIYTNKTVLQKRESPYASHKTSLNN